MRMMTTAAASVCLAMGLGGAALAQQSVGAPAGREAATAPGGTAGMAGPANTSEAVRDGAATPVAPGPNGGINPVTGQGQPPVAPAGVPATTTRP